MTREDQAESPDWKVVSTITMLSASPRAMSQVNQSIEIRQQVLWVILDLFLKKKRKGTKKKEGKKK